MFDKQDDSGVSPVIGVILMVAVTVALVALVTVTVFDLGGDVSDSPDATVQLEEDGGDVQATLLRNENVDKLYLQSGGATWGNDSNYADGGSDININSAGGTDTTSDYEAPLEAAGDVIDTAGFSDGSNDSGNTGSASDPNSGSPSSGDTVSVIAVMPDGNEEVLTSTELE